MAGPDEVETDWVVSAPSGITPLVGAMICMGAALTVQGLAAIFGWRLPMPFRNPNYHFALTGYGATKLYLKYSA